MTQSRTLKPFPHLAFKNVLWKPFGELEAFSGMGHLVSSHSLAINLSLLQTLFQFVWLHHALGTRTCANSTISSKWLQIRVWNRKNKAGTGRRSVWRLWYSSWIFQHHLIPSINPHLASLRISPASLRLQHYPGHLWMRPPHRVWAWKDERIETDFWEASLHQSLYLRNVFPQNAVH